MKIFKVIEPVYRTEPLFIANCSYDELRAYLKKRFRREIDPEDGLEGSVLTFDGTPWRVVWVKRRDDLPVLMHELFHLVTRICYDKQVPIVAHHPNGSNGDEAAAYLFEFFVRQCLKRRTR